MEYGFSRGDETMKRDTMNEQIHNPVFATAQQAMKTYEQAFLTGLKLQEETRQRLFANSCCCDYWQKPLSGLGGSMVDSMSQWLSTSIKTATEAAQSGWADMAARSVDNLCSNTQAISEASSQAMETWAKCVKNNMRNG